MGLVAVYSQEDEALRMLDLIHRFEERRIKQKKLPLFIYYIIVSCDGVDLRYEIHSRSTEEKEE